MGDIEHANQQHAGDLPLVLYQQDLERVLRCSRSTIDRLSRARQLPDPLPLPGRRRWSRGVVLDWLNAGGTRRRGGWPR
jgi:predicted DNA-binding transcriptional regulator AlpA